MKKVLICFGLILIFPGFIQAQYSGGNGRGDISAILTNTPLPVQKDIADIPVNYNLVQNFPNPFNSTTRIKFSLPHTSHVTIIIFNVLGKEVAVILDEKKPSGTYELDWNPKTLTSGIYFCQLRGGDYVNTIKMVLMQ